MKFLYSSAKSCPGGGTILSAYGTHTQAPAHEVFSFFLIFFFSLTIYNRSFKRKHAAEKDSSAEGSTKLSTWSLPCVRLFIYMNAWRLLLFLCVCVCVLSAQIWLRRNLSGLAQSNVMGTHYVSTGHEIVTVQFLKLILWSPTDRPDSGDDVIRRDLAYGLCKDFTRGILTDEYSANSAFSVLQLPQLDHSWFYNWTP